jgi:hypothetical protein
VSYILHLNFLTAGNFHFKLRRPNPFNEWKWYIITSHLFDLYFVWRCRIDHNKDGLFSICCG